jgi:penicillin-binding protein 1B
MMPAPPIDLESPRPPKQQPPLLHRPRVVAAIAAFTGALLLLSVAFFFSYLKLGRMIDRRLTAGEFSGTMNIYGAARPITTGDAMTIEELVTLLKHRGYTRTPGNPAGWFTVGPRAITITTSGGAFRVEFSRAAVDRIVSLQDRRDVQTIELAPQLITNISGGRERRRLVQFANIPERLVHAVISVEDKNFFQHSGVDLPRMVKAAYIDLKSGRREQGASTLTMQLVRSFWLEPGKSWRRKFQELILTLNMEHKLSKQQIFEDYANQVYLGRRDTFSISGFAEGAHAYFGKDLRELTNGEAAFLAGIVQRPSYYNPFRYPDRARQRRDVVLGLMLRNGYLNGRDYQEAISTPVVLNPERSEVQHAQYFVDLVRSEVETKLDERSEPAHEVYTSLDPDLQSAAEAAVRDGMAKVDHTLRARFGRSIPPGQPQVALIALDPHTGAVKALVGGRDYGASQLNHATAMRQPGSAFKPFVYAAALSTAVEGGRQIFTPASVINDTPSNFRYGNQDYEPHNYHNQTMGSVTLRYALAHSLNIATVSLATQVGLDRVVRVARRAGLNEAIRPTPAVALGAYESTPLEIAGAYTAFANQGLQLPASLVSEVRGGDGRVLYTRDQRGRAALDPRVAFLMVSMMQDVLRSGTGAGVRGYGFTKPAAGKTGTSRDGWFAGFTSELLCVVWVGFDDNRDLNLEGAHSALPIWAEFMARVSHLAPYRNGKAFAAPSGIRQVEICAGSGKLAGPYCPDVRIDVFIAGTEPVAECAMHGLTVVSAPEPEFTVPPPVMRDR